MNELERFYSAIGSNAKPVIERFGGNAEITKRFIKKFAAEESYENLKKAGIELSEVGVLKPHQEGVLVEVE